MLKPVLFIYERYFEKQLELSKKTSLPLFLHCRNAFPEFIGNELIM